MSGPRTRGLPSTVRFHQGPLSLAPKGAELLRLGLCGRDCLTKTSQLGDGNVARMANLFLLLFRFFFEGLRLGERLCRRLRELRRLALSPLQSLPASLFARRRPR